MRAIALGGIEPAKEPKKKRKRRKKKSTPSFTDLTPYLAHPPQFHYGVVTASPSYGPSYYSTTTHAAPVLQPTAYPALMGSTLRERVMTAIQVRRDLGRPDPTRVLLGQQERQELQGILTHDLGNAFVPSTLGTMAIHIGGLQVLFVGAESHLQVL